MDKEAYISVLDDANMQFTKNNTMEKILVTGV